MVTILLGAALFAVQAEAPAPAVASAEAPAETPSAAWSEAEANTEKAKSPPKLITATYPSLPEADKAAGRHGTVVVQGIAGLDGKLSELRIEESSNVPELDRLAMEAASAFTFEPATDANGNPIPIVISDTFRFSSYISNKGIGVGYQCDQFVRDMDWWQSTNPGKPFKEHELYKVLLGAKAAALMNSGNVRDIPKAFKDFEIRWTKAIEKCRKNPEMSHSKALLG